MTAGPAQPLLDCGDKATCPPIPYCIMVHACYIEWNCHGSLCRKRCQHDSSAVPRCKPD